MNLDRFSRSHGPARPRVDVAAENLGQLLEARLHLDRRADERNGCDRFAGEIVNSRRKREPRSAAPQVGRDARPSDRLVLVQELVDQLRFLFAPPSEIGLALRIAPFRQERLAPGGSQERAADIRLRVESSHRVATGFGHVDQMIAGLDSEVRRQPCFLVERGEVLLRDQPGPDVPARERQAVHRGAEIEAMLLLMKPAFGQKSADEPMDRALRCAEGANELSERQAWTVDDFFQNARDAIDGAVVLRPTVVQNDRRASRPAREHGPSRRTRSCLGFVAAQVASVYSDVMHRAVIFGGLP